MWPPAVTQRELELVSSQDQPFGCAALDHGSQAARTCGTMLFLYLFLTPTQSPTPAGPGTDSHLGFPQNKAASARHAKAEASMRAGERTPFQLLLLKERVKGMDLPLNRERGGGVGPCGERAGTNVPEMRHPTPIRRQEHGHHFSIQHTYVLMHTLTCHSALLPTL